MPGTPKQFDAWSYSRFSTYDQCPLKAKLAYLDKITEPPNKHMERGSEVHTKAEDFVKEGGRLPKELFNYREDFKRMRMAVDDPEAEVLVEQQWGFTKDFEPTGWFGKDTWFRAVVDLAVFHDGHLKIVDHKTGRQYDHHFEQIETYAIAGFMMFPEAETVSGEMWYLDHDQRSTKPLQIEFERKQLPELIKRWKKRVAPMFRDKKFPPRPNDKCRWCFYRKENGGPCKY